MVVMSNEEEKPELLVTGFGREPVTLEEAPVGEHT